MSIKKIIFTSTISLCTRQKLVKLCQPLFMGINLSYYAPFSKFIGINLSYYAPFAKFMGINLSYYAPFAKFMGINLSYYAPFAKGAAECFLRGGGFSSLEKSPRRAKNARRPPLQRGRTHFLSCTSTISFISICLIIFGFFYYGYFGTHLFLLKTSFEQIDNWQQDDQSQALQAFQKSCVEILRRDADKAFSKLSQSGKVSDWQRICLDANTLINVDAKTARQFFEYWFEPYYVTNNLNLRGFFTGYYLPLLFGSLDKDPRYSVPIHGVPKDLVQIDLGNFKAELLGQSIIGKLKNNSLVPYPDRATILQNNSDKNLPVLLWGNNPIDVFFAQIQGSAIVQLPNKQHFIIGYAGKNGHPYFAIGKALIEKGIPKENISMQSIKTWLLEHPDEVENILNRNKSYVFFKILDMADPMGAEGVPLTPKRSLAVDKHFMPLGAPIWLDTTIPVFNSEKEFMKFQHLMLAQDTGGAIKGVVRGDVYWGAGDEAAFIAGRMNSAGQYLLLLPRS